MRGKYRSVVVATVMVCAAWLGLYADAAQPGAGEQYVGKWTGTWEGEGSGSGRFELILESGSGAVTGGVDVGSDPGDYTAKFKVLSFEGEKMTARYAYPLDEQADIALTATFAGQEASGTWSLVPRDQDMVLASGTWKVAKQ